jgi:DMSO/TMAO reductase YedYZ heme-binding membrane subunit
MWQRIQTLFMLLAVGLMAAHLFLPSGTLNGTEIVPIDDLLPTLLTALAIVLGLAAITHFRQRKRQMLINWIATAVIAVIYILWLISDTRSAADYQVEWGMYLPGFAAIFLLIANTRIRKDEKLVSSMDRLR